MLRTIDVKGIEHTFKVVPEEIDEKNYKGIYYKIMVPSRDNWSAIHFVFKILFVAEKEIMIYWLDNQGYSEVSEKGITKAMIKYVRDEFKKDIISSTNTGQRFVNNEGRINSVTRTWNKWRSENDLITYDGERDRFIYKYQEEESITVSINHIK